MSTLEFTANVRDGKIEIPEEYREFLQDIQTVKITVTAEGKTAAIGMIARLINHPIQVKSFIPLTREEVHERG